MPCSCEKYISSNLAFKYCGFLNVLGKSFLLSNLVCPYLRALSAMFSLNSINSEIECTGIVEGNLER